MLVQSPEGQRRVRCLHEHFMGVLGHYPAISRHVFDQEWADSFLREMLASAGNVESLGYPELYGVIHHVEFDSRMFPPQFHERSDQGLSFILGKARKQNRTDLVGNLRSGISCSAVFELLLAWALTTEFGASAIEPYPLIDPPKKSTVDFALRCDGFQLFFEAVCLIKDRVLGGPRPTTIVTGHRVEANRFLQTCKDKALQRTTSAPLVLCVNQIPPFPLEDVAKECIQELVHWLNDTDGSKVAAVARFHGYYLRELSVCDENGTTPWPDKKLLGRIDLALQRINSAPATQAEQATVS
jgi:hypothetical protein